MKKCFLLIFVLLKFKILFCDSINNNEIFLNQIRKDIISSVYIDIILNKISDINIENDLKLKIVDSIVYYSLKYNINPILVYNIIKTESNFNPYAISNKNAKGLMQLKDIAILDLNESLENKKEIFSINKNIELGIKYLKKMIKKANGNIPLALTFYNRGIGRVKKDLQNGFTVSKVVKNKYVEKVLGE